MKANISCLVPSLPHELNRKSAQEALDIRRRVFFTPSDPIWICDLQIPHVIPHC
jgi:hypothetical protein